MKIQNTCDDVVGNVCLALVEGEVGEQLRDANNDDEDDDDMPLSGLVHRPSVGGGGESSGAALAVAEARLGIR
jgi:hypothetical protein